MRAQYIEAIDMVPPIYKNSIFLAGGISGCDNWQLKAVDAFKDLPITIINPRRDGFDVGNMLNSVDQIKWEHKYLSESNYIMFWFPDATLCPITLYELGKCLTVNKLSNGALNLYIGCAPAYKRVFDVEIQSMLMGYHRPIFKDLDSLLTFIKTELT